MLIPMSIPLFYGIKYKRESLLEIIIIILVMIGIVIFYWPLTLGFDSSANIITKFLLFVLVPLFFLILSDKIRYKQKNEKLDFQFSQFGITSNGIEKSLKLGFLFLPLMLIITFIAKYMMGGVFNPNFPLGVVSFVESFTEEFFFRGILFLFLMSKTNLKIAYITSLGSFILMHPQNFTNPFIISTIVQGLVTLEICRRTSNLAGAWIVHGTNRFFSIFLYPLLM
jgi:membrane protease YdiL (CAAX protease family)